MMPIQTKAFGVITEPRQLAEFYLILSTLDSAMWHDAAGVADVMTWFDQNYIADPYYRAVFSRLIAMFPAVGPVDEYTIAKGLQDSGKEFGLLLTDIGNLILDCTSQRAHLQFYAQEVLREHRRINATVDISGAAEDMAHTDDPDAVLEQLPEIAARYAPPAITRTTDNRKMVHDIIAELEEKQQDKAFRFGIDALDQIVGGVPAGALMTIGARTSNGKSVFLGQCALRCADRDGKAVLFFSGEMTQRELGKRWASALSRQPHPKQGGDQRQYLSGLARVERLLDGQLLHVFAGPRTVEQISADAKAYATRCELGLIVVDYIQAVVPTRSRTEGREQQVAHIAASLKHLASSTGVPVLTASQLNKDGNDTPSLATLRESEAIANYSNIVLLLAPERKPGDVVKMEINIAKNRDGKTDLVVAIWEKNLFTIRAEEAADLPNYERAFE